MIKAMAAAALRAAGVWLANLLLGLSAQWQARADQRQLGADDAERATDTVIDAVEADQDEIDKMVRGGAAGVLDRLRRAGDGTAADADR